MPRPYSDFFPDFPKILRSRNRNLKASHNTSESCRMHSRAFFLRQPLLSSKQLYMGWKD